MSTFEAGVSTSPGFGFSTISTTPWAGAVTQEAAALAVGVADGTAWAAGSANAAVLRSAVSSPTIIALIPQAEVRGERKLPSTRFVPSWTITLRPPVWARSLKRTLAARMPPMNAERQAVTRVAARRNSNGTFVGPSKLFLLGKV